MHQCGLHKTNLQEVGKTPPHTHGTSFDSRAGPISERVVNPWALQTGGERQGNSGSVRCHVTTPKNPGLLGRNVLAVNDSPWPFNIPTLLRGADSKDAMGAMDACTHTLGAGALQGQWSARHPPWHYSNCRVFPSTKNTCKIYLQRGGGHSQQVKAVLLEGIQGGSLSEGLTTFPTLPQVVPYVHKQSLGWLCSR